jgi:ABC-2 type transport system permease protein
MQTIAQFLSTTYVFEGMRALILRGEWLPNLLWYAFFLNGVYFIVGLSVFCLALKSARKRGLLLQSGE